MSTAEVDKAIGLWLELFTLLRDERGVFNVWRELVVSHDVKGKQAHDARLAAAMRRHGLTHLLSFNVSDFQRYDGLVALDAKAAETP